VKFLRRASLAALALFAIAIGTVVSTAAAPTVAPAAAADKPLIALTFDDGPSAERTNFVLDVLKQKGVHATFFLLGSHAQQFPDLVSRIKAEGHVIGNHSWDHADFTTLSQADQKSQIDRTNTAIQAITGQTPQLMRFPYGNSTSYGLSYLKTIGMYGGVLWHWDSSNAGDYECPGAAGVQRYVLSEAVDGAIILLHDATDVLSCPSSQWNYLASTIDALRSRGFDFGVVAPSATANPINQGSPAVVVASPVASDPGTVVKSSSTTTIAADRTTVRPGRTVNLSGRVRIGGVNAAGKTVTVDWQAGGTTTWTPIRTVTTNSTGSYSFGTPVQNTGTFRATYAGDATSIPSSATVRVSVR
jgi:peptidoglycan/xylan/chitin deacetylase (PgdA/CDA1 family)